MCHETKTEVYKSSTGEVLDDHGGRRPPATVGRDYGRQTSDATAVKSAYQKGWKRAANYFFSECELGCGTTARATLPHTLHLEGNMIGPSCRVSCAHSFGIPVASMLKVIPICGKKPTWSWRGATHVRLAQQVVFALPSKTWISTPGLLFA